MFQAISFMQNGWQHTKHIFLNGFHNLEATTLIIRNFYFVCAAIIGIFLLIGILLRKKEFQIRSLTLLVVLHIICLSLWLGSTAFAFFVCLVYFLGLREISRHYKIPPFQFWLVNIPIFLLLIFLADVMLILIPFFLAISLVTFLGPPRLISKPTFAYCFSIFFMAVCAVFLILLAVVRIETIIILLFLIQMNDAFGLLFGKLLGRHRLFKTISPNKTLEGYLFGGVGIILGIILLHTVMPVLPKQSYFNDGLLFIYIFLFGNAGDLLLSSLKRKIGIKDFSNILPGHGGILDRFDNIFFTAPVFYLLIFKKILILPF